MARNIGADGADVFRTVTTTTYDNGATYTKYEGPYATLGAARARATFWRNHLAYEDGPTVETRVEQAHTTWAPVDEQPEPEQYRTDADGRPTYAHTDVDGDRLLVAPAVFLAHGAEHPGIYFRTSPSGSSIHLDDLPAFIARLPTIADTARTEAAEESR